MECVHCKKIYSSKPNLVNHQKTARFCLKIQGKEIEEKFKCELCNDVFNNNKYYVQHCKICSSSPIALNLLNKIKMLEDGTRIMEEEHNLKVEFKDKQILTYEITLESKREEILNLKREINKLNKRFDNIVSKPSTVVQHHHVDNSVNNFNCNVITLQTCQGYTNFLTNEHIEAGAAGIAKYALEYPLKNGYTVTDPDRKIIKYNNGQEIVQTSVVPLRQIICESISDKHHELRQNKARSEYAKISNGTATTEEVLENVINFGDTCDAIIKSAKTGDSDKTDFDHELENNLINYHHS